MHLPPGEYTSGTLYLRSHAHIHIEAGATLFASHDVKDFLARHSVPYQWLDLESNPEARTLLKAANLAEMSVPVLFFPDGTTLVQPTAGEVAIKVGLRTRAENPFYDVTIIGGGPAGLSASVIASADGLKVLLIERNAPGGQAGCVGVRAGRR